MQDHSCAAQNHDDTAGDRAGISQDHRATTQEQGTDLAARMVGVLRERLRIGHDAARLVVETLFAGGHLLLDDVPGVGKTTLARAVAGLVGGTTHRIQFTSDLLPGDLTGVTIFDQSTRTFSFQPGPLFANVVIADEINRANPRTQSAMLESMSEGTVSVDGRTHRLPDMFFVVATQNPVEQQGTFPLPEAQLDRFMTCLSLGYPRQDVEISMLQATSQTDPLDGLEPIGTLGEVLKERARIARYFVSRPVAAYARSILEATRTSPRFSLGASPRAGIALMAMSRVRADIDGRDFVTPEDVRSLAVPVLAHRLILGSSAEEAGQDIDEASQVLSDLVGTLPVPRERR